MWTIKQLKVRGKICFQRNYWKAVLVALVITLTGGMQGHQVIRSLTMTPINKSMSATFKELFGHTGGIKSNPNYKYNNPYQSPGGSFGDPFGDDFSGDFNFGFGGNNNPYSRSTNPFSDFAGSPTAAAVGLALVVFFILLMVVFIIMILSILLDVFIKNPLFIGTQRFFIHNLTADGMVGDMGFGFDRGYKNQVRVMFFRDLYTFAWTLLFVIPGLIKSYEYRMIPYLMAEYPQMDKEQAFFTSRYLMHGNKWRAFLLDLSFIGWWILSSLSLGLVGLFFVNPYYASTCAALYEALKAIKGIPDYNPNGAYYSNQENVAFAGADVRDGEGHETEAEEAFVQEDFGSEEEITQMQENRGSESEGNSTEENRDPVEGEIQSQESSGLTGEDAQVQEDRGYADDEA